MDILKKFRVEETVAEGNLTKNQKLAIFGLVVFAIVLLVFWGVGMKNNIYRPLSHKVDQTANEGTCPNGNCDQDPAKTQDTDNDGLSDWEEANFYSTSPYIDDTDSDGLKDGDEVLANSDPNCPRGQDCGRDSSPDVLSATSAASGMPDSFTLDKDQVQANEGDLNKAFTGQADAKTLRNLLKESGVPQNVLDQMTDEQLMASYAETLRQISNEGQ